MENLNQYTDDEFEHLFETCTLDPALFNHTGHLRLGWIHIKKYGLEKAIKNLCTQIDKFDKTYGDGTKYNEKITIVAAKIMAKHMEITNTDSFEKFIKRNPDLLNNFLHILKSYK